MRTVLRLAGWAIAIVVVLAVAGFFALSRANIPYATLEAKYGTPADKFMDLPNGVHVHYRDQGDPNGEAIVLPAVSKEVDYEAELVLVVGKKGRLLKEESALDYLAGYTIGHDVSARDWQLKKDGKQWLAGKTFDTFAPCGPVLVTRDDSVHRWVLPGADTVEAEFFLVIA